MENKFVILKTLPAPERNERASIVLHLMIATIIYIKYTYANPPNPGEHNKSFPNFHLTLLNGGIFLFPFQICR